MWRPDECRSCLQHFTLSRAPTPSTICTFTSVGSSRMRHSPAQEVVSRRDSDGIDGFILCALPVTHTLDPVVKPTRIDIAASFIMDTSEVPLYALRDPRWMADRYAALRGGSKYQRLLLCRRAGDQTRRPNPKAYISLFARPYMVRCGTSGPSPRRMAPWMLPGASGLCATRYPPGGLSGALLHR